MNNSGPIIAILVVVIIGVVGWLAYSQGFFEGKAQDDAGLEIQIGGESENEY